jgi:hypothetical protein
MTSYRVPLGLAGARLLEHGAGLVEHDVGIHGHVDGFLRVQQTIGAGQNARSQRIRAGVRRAARARSIIGAPRARAGDDDGEHHD